MCESKYISYVLFRVDKIVSVDINLSDQLNRSWLGAFYPGSKKNFWYELPCDIKLYIYEWPEGDMLIDVGYQ